jgi:lipopolysaccharide transport system permease protein
MEAITALWRYRGFIVGNVVREFQSKYRNSLLGAAWNIINPLSMIVVYTVIFSQLMRSRLPGVDSVYGFSIYLCTGILTWGLFSEISQRATGMFLENANLLKKLSFPRLCLPVTVVCNATLNFSIVFGLFTIFLILSNSFPGWTFIALIPLLFLLITLAIGIGITLGLLNVFFRDVGQFYGIFLSFWFWFTPIVYPVSILPGSVQSIIRFNPMARLITAFQDVVLNNQWPNWYSLWPVCALAIVMCAIGMRLFRLRSGEMIDEL